jgi:hypothetical protein
MCGQFRIVQGVEIECQCVTGLLVPLPSRLVLASRAAAQQELAREAALDEAAWWRKHPRRRRPPASPEPAVHSGPPAPTPQEVQDGKLPWDPGYDDDD